MEYAAGGELFDRICTAGRFSEDEVILMPFPPFISPLVSHFFYFTCSLDLNFTFPVALLGILT